MPTVIAHHSVKEEHPLGSPKREEVFGPTGVIKHPDLRRPAASNPVAVLMDVADRDIVTGAMQSERLADAMEYDGVLGESLVILVE